MKLAKILVAALFAIALLSANAMAADEAAAKNITVVGKIAKDGEKFVLVDKDGAKIALPEAKEIDLKAMVDKNVTITAEGSVKDKVTTITKIVKVEEVKAEAAK
jgi:hypothetical protein